MAKPPKDIGLSLQAVTNLDLTSIASMAVAAAEKASSLGVSVRLESSEAGLLVFSVRGVVFELMLFHLVATVTSSATYITTTMVRYKIKSGAYGRISLIPIGPRYIEGAWQYRKWIKSFAGQLTDADPTASVQISS